MASKTPLATLRALVKSVDPETKVSKYGDWEGEFTVRVHHEVTAVERALKAAGYVKTQKNDVEGGHYDWWTVLTVAAPGAEFLEGK